MNEKGYLQTLMTFVCLCLCVCGRKDEGAGDCRGSKHTFVSDVGWEPSTKGWVSSRCLQGVCKCLQGAFKVSEAFIVVNQDQATVQAACVGVGIGPQIYLSSNVVDTANEDNEGNCTPRCFMFIKCHTLGNIAIISHHRTQITH